MSSRPSRRLIALWVIVGALVVAVALVVALGGLQQRKTQLIDVPYGQQVDSGMMVYEPMSATVVRHTDAIYNSPWQLVILMKVRNPQSESLAPVDPTKPTMFGIDPNTRLVAQASSYSLSWTMPDTSSYAAGVRKLVPPQSDWMYLSLRINLDDPYTPADTYILAIRPMEFKTTAAYGYSDLKSWAPNTYARVYAISVPLTQLPDD